MRVVEFHDDPVHPQNHVFVEKVTRYVDQRESRLYRHELHVLTEETKESVPPSFRDPTFSSVTPVWSIQWLRSREGK